MGVLDDWFEDITWGDVATVVGGLMDASSQIDAARGTEAAAKFQREVDILNLGAFIESSEASLDELELVGGTYNPATGRYEGGLAQMRADVARNRSTWHGGQAGYYETLAAHQRASGYGQAGRLRAETEAGLARDRTKTANQRKAANAKLLTVESELGAVTARMRSIERVFGAEMQSVAEGRAGLQRVHEAEMAESATRLAAAGRVRTATRATAATERGSLRAIYTAEMVELRARRTALTTELAGLTKTVAAKRKAITANQRRVAVAQGRLGEDLEARLGTISSQLAVARLERDYTLKAAQFKRQEIVQDVRIEEGAAVAGAAARGTRGSAALTTSRMARQKASRQIGVLAAQTAAQVGAIGAREEGLFEERVRAETGYVTGTADLAAEASDLAYQQVALTTGEATSRARIEHGLTEVSTAGVRSTQGLALGEARVTERVTRADAAFDVTQAQVGSARARATTRLRTGLADIGVRAARATGARETGVADAEAARARLGEQRVSAQNVIDLSRAEDKLTMVREENLDGAVQQIIDDHEMQARAHEGQQWQHQLAEGEAEVTARGYDLEAFKAQNDAYDLTVAANIGRWTLENFPDLPDYVGAATTSAVGSVLTGIGEAIG